MNNSFPTSHALAENIEPIPFDKDHCTPGAPNTLTPYATILSDVLFDKPNPMGAAIHAPTNNNDAVQRQLEQTQRQLEEMTRERDQALAMNQQLVRALSQVQTTLYQERETGKAQIEQVVQQEQQQHEQFIEDLVFRTLPPNSIPFPARLKKTKGGNFRNYVAEGKLLGSGGYGKVVRACPITDRVRQYALKVASKSKEDNVNEVKILRRIHHTNIIMLHDCVEDESTGEIGLVLELGASDLSDYRDRQPYQSCSLDDRREISRALLKALRYLHLNGIAHLDIKPENMIITRITSPLRQEYIKLCDFGLAITADGNKPLVHSNWKGTPGYFAPEMANFNRYCAKAIISPRRRSKTPSL